jgi:hypothetical protein
LLIRIVSLPLLVWTRAPPLAAASKAIWQTKYGMNTTR